MSIVGIAGLVRRTAVAAFVLAAFVLAVSAAALPGASEARSAAPSESGAPPYCVLIAGARGTDLPQICRFYDYQSCLQAAADLRGNCVANIDFHGEMPKPSGPAGFRGR